MTAYFPFLCRTSNVYFLLKNPLPYLVVLITEHREVQMDGQSSSKLMIVVTPPPMLCSKVNNKKKLLTNSKQVKKFSQSELYADRYYI